MEHLGKKYNFCIHLNLNASWRPFINNNNKKMHHEDLLLIIIIKNASWRPFINNNNNKKCIMKSEDYEINDFEPF